MVAPDRISRDWEPIIMRAIAAFVACLTAAAAAQADEWKSISPAEATFDASSLALAPVSVERRTRNNIIRDEHTEFGGDLDGFVVTSRVLGNRHFFRATDAQKLLDADAMRDWVDESWEGKLKLTSEPSRAENNHGAYLVADASYDGAPCVVVTQPVALDPSKKHLIGRSLGPDLMVRGLLCGDADAVAEAKANLGKLRFGK